MKFPKFVVAGLLVMGFALSALTSAYALTARERLLLRKHNASYCVQFGTC